MHYFLCVHLDRFYIAALKEKAESPCLVTAEKHVIDLDEAAEKRGVRVGMSVRQARAILPEGKYVTWQEESGEELQKRWLDLCTEFTGIIEPEQPHLAFLDLSGHPSPADVAGKVWYALTHKLHLHVRARAARTKWIARLALQHANGELAVDNPQAFLDQLPVSELLPVPIEHRTRLRFLGYRTIEQVRTIPLGVLKTQFGDEGLLIHQAARGAIFEPVLSLYPPGTLIENFVFESPVDSLETVDMALGKLASRIGERMCSASQQCLEVRGEIEFEEGKRLARKRRFTRPVRCSRTALAALKLLFQGVFTAPVVAIRVVLPELKRVAHVQQTLVGQGSAKEKDQSVKAAFQYVKTVFGDQSLILGGQMEVPRRVRVLREWKDAIGWR